MMQAPPGSRCSERAVVVCMPRLSCGAPRRCPGSRAPSSVFVSVDLPAPDEPSSTIVWPAAGDVREALARAAGSVASTTTVSTVPPGCACRSASSRSSRRSGSARGMSALVRTTIGAMPLACDQRQVALEPAQVEVVVEAHHEQGRSRRC